ncbi:MAG: GNAT family N-acetyltransferase [Minwuiales bacterium]|nr:GNAT family N-acetyltransferase [Minwuiales bacterium]
MDGIRKFQESDIGPLQRLIHDTIDISYAEVYPPRAVEFFKEFHAEDKILARSRAGTILVVEEDGELVGTGSIVDGEIFAVFVHPKCQSGGRGKALMQRLEDQARAEGVVESELSVSLPSLKFYQRLGYEIVEERSRDLGEGQRLDFWAAKKTLTPTQPG